MFSLLKYYNTKFSDDLVDGDASTYFEIDQYEFRTSDNMSILKDKIKVNRVMIKH